MLFLCVSFYLHNMKRTALAFLLLATMILSMVRCITPQGAATSGNAERSYDFDYYPMHPQMVLYHSSDDSTILFIKFKSKELLYTRGQGEKDFNASLRIIVQAYQQGDDLSVKDSAFFHMMDKTGAGKDLDLIGSKTIHLAPGLYTLRVNVIDEHRNSSSIFLLTADKDDVHNRQNFFVHRKGSIDPLFMAFAEAGTTLVAENKRRVQKQISSPIRVLRISSDQRLPPPPFSNAVADILNPGLANSTPYVTGQADVCEFVADQGYFLITGSDGEFAGSGIACSSPFYPAIEALDQLAPPLRYITSKAEFDEITKHSFPKKLIDRFWLDCGGSKEKAKDLIRAYYTRVEEANIFFSTYTEGWKTDRGMVHLVFGNPTSIKPSANGESWIYGDEGNPASLIFYFKKIENPLSGNVYVLQRDPQYKQVWEQMVSSWRTGRIYLQ